MENVAKLFLSFSEMGEMHNKDCCCNTEHGCDFYVGILDCCANMRALRITAQEIANKVIDNMSYDLNYSSEEQRLEAVKMLCKDLDEHIEKI